MNTNLGRKTGEIVAHRIDGALAIYDYTNEDEFDIGHVVMSDGRKARQAPLLSILAHGYWSDDLSAVMNPFTVRKHQAGKHDQKLHGSWANQMELEGLESPLSGEYGDWGDRAAELEAARSIGPDEEYLRDAVLFKPDPRSVSDMAVRERIKEYHEYDIFNEVEQRMSSLEDEDMSEYEGLSNNSIRDKFIEEAVDQYVADYGDEARQAIAMENATVAFDFDFDSMGEVFNVTHEGFNRDGAPVNLSSQVLEVESSAGQVSVMGEIKEGDYDITVGEFHRVFSSDDYGNVIVTHELLRIFEEEYQGTGFSKVFNRQAENYYITHGIDAVYVHAALQGGGYAWASSGFDWDYRKHADSVRNVSAWMDDYIIKNRDTIPDDLKSDLRSLQTRLESSPVSNRDYPTPKEIADFGRISGVDTWPGKEILMGSNWYGKKTLRPEGARVSETEAKNNAARAAREASEQERARAAAERAPTRGQLTMDTGFLEGSLAQDPNFQPGLFSPIPGVVE